MTTVFCDRGNEMVLAPIRTVNVCVTGDAAGTEPSPGWAAVMVQLPIATKVIAPPAVTVQTLGELDE